MNKKLIRKYKAEFEYWLNGGSILVKYANPKQAAPGYTDWHEDDSVWNSNLDYLIVINDDYAIYRKALAEGKTVEVRKKYDYKELNEELWRLFAIGCSTFDLPVSEYRIKPKFKVGDWVRQGTRVFQYSYKDLQYDKANPTHCQNDKKWEPREGETCIFWGEDSEYNRAIVGKLKQILSNGNYVMDYGSGNTATYRNCMPFTGTLPPHMKDSK